MSDNAVLVDWQLQQLVDEARICDETGEPVPYENIQPNSLDLRVGPVAYRVDASFLPQKEGIEYSKREGAYEIDLTGMGATLEPGTIYLVPLKERLRLPPDLRGHINPKSSTGRLDIFCRAVTDRAPGFDEVRAGYDGPLFLEIVPRSFAIGIREDDTLSQLRLFHGDPVLNDDEIRDLIGTQVQVYDYQRRPIPNPKIERGLLFGVNLKEGPQGETSKNPTVGYRALRNRKPIIFSQLGYSRRNYWDYIWYGGQTDVILQPAEFYIFGSSERLSLGEAVCAEMVPYDAGMGEVRSHYAGFFDSGFGWEGRASAAQIVLEIRNHHVPYALAHGQILFRVQVLRNAAAPKRLYGDPSRRSSYQSQGLRLAKQFKAFQDEDPYVGMYQPTLFNEEPS